ncbi:MAG: ATP-binding protein [Tahibacter sp.]
MTLAFAVIAVQGLLLIALFWRWRWGQIAQRKVLARLASDRMERENVLQLQSAAQERERIFNDLHDDLGAKLLGLVHTAESPQQADRARSILADLRDVVSRSRATPGTLADALADIRTEVRQRLADVAIDLIWDEQGDLPEPALQIEQSLHLQRIVREAVSNVIRHAHARALRVRLAVRSGDLLLELTDDGHRGVVAGGTGMRSMRHRAEELAGDIRWTEGTAGGTKVLLRFPLPGTVAKRA